MPDTGGPPPMATQSTEINPQPAPSSGIRDRLFIQQLLFTRDLVNFLIRKQVALDKSPEVLSTLTALGHLHYSPWGRSASESEWTKLYAASHAFIVQLPSTMSMTFGLWRLRNFFTLFPILFLSMAMLALGFTFIFSLGDDGKAPGFWLFLNVLFWTYALGGLGVCAFFGTSILNQLTLANETSLSAIELTDGTYLRNRLIVGILFAFVLGLPFGNVSLLSSKASLIHEVPWDASLVVTLTKIVAPFLLGFSTPLVLSILDRLIDGVRTVLGVQK